jgi:hypothetical protein
MTTKPKSEIFSIVKFVAVLAISFGAHSALACTLVQSAPKGWVGPWPFVPYSAPRPGSNVVVCPPAGGGGTPLIKIVRRVAAPNSTALLSVSEGRALKTAVESGSN